MKSIKTRNVIGEVIGIILALIILSPFILVVLNSAKTSADIVISPLSIPNKWGQMLTNFKNVINNDSFNYWKSFFSSLFITVVSLALLSLFSSMTAWVLCRIRKNGLDLFLCFLWQLWLYHSKLLCSPYFLHSEIYLISWEFKCCKVIKVSYLLT